MSYILTGYQLLKCHEIHFSYKAQKINIYSFNMLMSVAIRSISLVYYVNIWCSEKIVAKCFRKNKKKTSFCLMTNKHYAWFLDSLVVNIMISHNIYYVLYNSKVKFFGIVQLSQSEMMICQETQSASERKQFKIDFKYMVYSIIYKLKIFTSDILHECLYQDQQWICNILHHCW